MIAHSNPDEKRSLLKRSRYLPRGKRNEVWNRDEGRCTYVSPEGKQCNETKFLELDDKTPFALNGSSTDSENLRLLCSGHNKFLAIKMFGRRWVEEKIRSLQ